MRLPHLTVLDIPKVSLQVNQPEQVGMDVLTPVIVISSAQMQAKMATPSDAVQVITPDAGYDGLSSVTIAAIPSNWGRITYGGSNLRIS